jgi:hypothetical protein
VLQRKARTRSQGIEEDPPKGPCRLNTMSSGRNEKRCLSFQETNLDYDLVVLDRGSNSSVAIDTSFSDAPLSKMSCCIKSAKWSGVKSLTSIKFAQTHQFTNLSICERTSGGICQPSLVEMSSRSCSKVMPVHWLQTAASALSTGYATLASFRITMEPFAAVCRVPFLNRRPNVTVNLSRSMF